MQRRVDGFDSRVLLASIVLSSTVTACQSQTGTPAGETVPPPERMEVVTAPVVTQDTARLPRPAVQVGCREDQPRVSFAEFTWPTIREVHPDSIALDYTVFKDGFQTQQYATLSQGRQPKAQLVYRPQVPLVALNLQNASRRVEGNATSVRVERLDAGVNYLWRLRLRTGGQWTAGPVVRVSAPTCADDETERR